MLGGLVCRPALAVARAGLPHLLMSIESVCHLLVPYLICECSKEGSNGASDGYVKRKPRIRPVKDRFHAKI